MTPGLETAAPQADPREQRIAALVATYQQPLLRYATRLLNNATLAQDAVQNALIKLCRHWQPNQAADDAIRPWLYRVTHNEAVDLVRHEERRRRHQQRCCDDPSLEPPAAPGAMEREDRQDQVMRALRTLTAAERQVVLLRLQQGLSYDEMAAATGRPRGTVGALLHTAVKKLARTIQHEEVT